MNRLRRRGLRVEPATWKLLQKGGVSCELLEELGSGATRLSGLRAELVESAARHDVRRAERAMEQLQGEADVHSYTAILEVWIVFKLYIYRILRDI